MEFGLNSENKALLERAGAAVKSGHISHAYIIESPSETERTAFAKWFIKAILCEERRGDDCGRCPVCSKVEHGNHEDVIHLQKEKVFLRVDEIKRVQAQLDRKPFGSRNIAVIEDADFMNEAASNRLLKTLEEPPGDAVLILLSENTENLLPTIRSRCIRYRLEGVAGEPDEKIRRQAAEVIRIAAEGGPYYRMKKAMGKSADSREKAAAFIDCMEEACRQLLLSRDDKGVLRSPRECGRMIGALEESRRQLASGMSQKYIMKRLLLTIGG